MMYIQRNVSGDIIAIYGGQQLSENGASLDLEFITEKDLITELNSQEFQWEHGY